jgi:hypothetical protein
LDVGEPTCADDGDPRHCAPRCPGRTDVDDPAHAQPASPLEHCTRRGAYRAHSITTKGGAADDGAPSFALVAAVRGPSSGGRTRGCGAPCR